MVLHSGLRHFHSRHFTTPFRRARHQVDAGGRAFPGDLRTNLLGAQHRTGVLAVETEAQGRTGTLCRPTDGSCTASTGSRRRSAELLRQSDAVRLKVDVIVTYATPIIMAAKQRHPQAIQWLTIRDLRSRKRFGGRQFVTTSKSTLPVGLKTRKRAYRHGYLITSWRAVLLCYVSRIVSCA